MNRLCLTLYLALAFVSSGFAAEHFPLGPGMAWDYVTLQFGEVRGQTRLEVAAVREDGTYVLTSSAGGEPLLYAVEGQQVFLVADGGERSLFLDFSAAEGESWDVACGTATVVSTSETVTVRGGVFNDCFRIQLTCEPLPPVSVWYARGVGRVKSEAGSTSDELRGYEPLDGFRRGDTDADGNFNITDGVYLLNWLFLSGDAPPCLESADVDGDGSVVVTDAIYALNFLFLSGDPPPAPFPDCARWHLYRFPCEEGPPCG